MEQTLSDILTRLVHGNMTVIAALTELVEAASNDDDIEFDDELVIIEGLRLALLDLVDVIEGDQ